MPAYKTQLVTNATFRGKSKLADGAEFDIEGELGLLDDAPLNFGDSDDGSIEYVSATPALVLTVASADLTLSTTVTGSVEIDGIDGVTIESASGDLDIGADAVTGAVNIGTGAAARPITIGNALSASLDIESGVGAMTVQGDTTIDIDAGTAIGIESAGGAISIGADAVAQAVNIGTGAAARAIAIGNGASASLAMDGGVGAVTLQGDTTIDLDSGTTMDLAAEGVLTARTNDQTGTGAGGASAALTIDTGDRNIDDAAGSPGTGALTLISGDTEVDNGAGAATGGDSGAVGLLSGDTNCQDAAGTGGDSGAVIVKSGDADSDAGGSGSSGSLTLETGFSDDANSGDITIDAGSAAVTPGNIIIGGDATLVALDSVTKFRASGGADAAAALLGGVGTTGSPATTAVAGQNMLEFRVQTTATSGDFRGLYIRADFDGDGVAGEGIRSNCVSDQDVAGTVNGIHASFEVKAGGDITGAAHGGRFGFIVPDDSSITQGTVAGAMSEIYLTGTSSTLNATQHSLHRFTAAGANAATRNAEVLNLFSVEGVTTTSGGMYYANTAAVPGNANASLRIITPDGIKHILLFDAEA
ncbi:hypothetical protein HN371_08605 [Candidatus Poribacteria bacterium]|nr:hypothetical protein [Candidatus Poribacteria bacterium]MBT7098062.1 hypothetical protein [Candidatus Poribacteria bacterium]